MKSVTNLPTCGKPLANPYRDRSTRDLELIYESLSWNLAEYQAEAEAFVHVEALPTRINGTIDFLNVALALADDELERRRRLRDRPGAPPWPERRTDAERVKAAARIEDFAERFCGVTLRQRGAALWGRCPLHDDHSPSFAISPDKQLFHCFGCGAGGDVFTLAGEVLRLGFRDALAVVAQLAGIAAPERAGSPAPGWRGLRTREVRRG